MLRTSQERLRGPGRFTHPAPRWHEPEDTDMPWGEKLACMAIGAAVAALTCLLLSVVAPLFLRW